MKLWLVSQDANAEYDTYDSAVVVAESEDEAKKVHPFEGKNDENSPSSDWAPPSKVTAVYIGETELPAGKVVCASFNAG